MNFVFFMYTKVKIEILVCTCNVFSQCAHYPWIVVCTVSFTFFSAACSAKHQGLLIFPKDRNYHFFHNVFMYWIKVLEQYHEHENNTMYKDALLKLAAKSSSKGIGVQLHAQHDASQAHNRKMLIAL